MDSARRISRKIHPVVFVGVFCAAILAGVVLARFFPGLWLTNWLWLVVFGLLAIGLTLTRQRWALVAVFLVGILLGYARGNIQMQGVLAVQAHIESTVVLRGKVEEDPGVSGPGYVALRLGSAQINGHAAAGSYWVVLAGQNDGVIRRGDIVEVESELKPGFGAFAGSMYRAKLLHVAKEQHGDIFVEIRDWFSGAIRTHLPETEAALGAGYVLGEKRALPSDFDEALRIVGLTHVVVASGYNLTILVRLARRLFAKISRYMAVAAGGAMVVIFAGITGLGPSMVRAGMVSGLSLLAWYYGRKLHPLVILLVSAAASVLIQPSYAWGDVGWLLSFTAFAGVMFLAPLLQAYFFGKKQPGVLRQIIGETLSAQILTAPVIIVMFGSFSIVALLANALVLPLVPLAMLLVFITGITTLFAPFLAVFAALPTEWLLSYMVGVVNILAEVSWALHEVEWGVAEALACYAVIFLVIVWLARKTKFKFIDVNIVK